MSIGYVFFGADAALTVAVVDDNGNPATPTSLTVTLTDPNNGVSTGTLGGGAPAGPVQNPASAGSTGIYQAVVTSPSIAGVWTARWVASGTGFNFVFEDQFEVRPRSAMQIVDLASVKRHLGDPQADHTQDDALQAYIVGAQEQFRDICGPLFPEQHTQYITGGTRSITVDWLPLQSVQSITEYYYGLVAFAITEQPLGTSSSAFGFTADYNTGEITRRTFGAAGQWAAGTKNVKVVYTAGWWTPTQVVPFNVRRGALKLIQHWWQQDKQRGPRQRYRGGDGDEPFTVDQYAIPYEVEALWSPWRRPPGIA